MAALTWNRATPRTHLPHTHIYLVRLRYSYPSLRSLLQAHSALSTLCALPSRG